MHDHSQQADISFNYNLMVTVIYNKWNKWDYTEKHSSHFWLMLSVVICLNDESKTSTSWRTD